MWVVLRFFTYHSSLKTWTSLGRSRWVCPSYESPSSPLRAADALQPHGVCPFCRLSSSWLHFLRLEWVLCVGRDCSTPALLQIGQRSLQMNHRESHNNDIYVDLFGMKCLRCMASNVLNMLMHPELSAKQLFSLVADVYKQSPGDFSKGFTNMRMTAVVHSNIP